MILVAFGTRPELLKLEPLLKYWKSIGFEDWRIWLTFQHKELCMELIRNWEFKNNIWTLFDNTCIGGMNRLDEMVIATLSSMLDKEWRTDLSLPEYRKVKAILVQGDTVSAFSCALSAFHRRIPIIHLEAGLRSWDNENPYPEEFYRRSISMMASVNLCPTQYNLDNLYDERVPGKCYITGNTIIDSIKNLKAPLTPKNQIIITLHRRENLDKIKEWFDVLEFLAQQYKGFEFILPIHKNPEIYKYKETFSNVKCVDPLDHQEFIDILKDSVCIISDSGGVAEEASWFGKTIFLCRKATERPEADNFYVFCGTPEELKSNFIKEVEKHFPFDRKGSCLFGDGNASEKITNILKELKYM